MDVEHAESEPQAERPCVALLGGPALDREALGALLRSTGTLRVAGVYAEVDDLLPAFEAEEPDVTILNFDPRDESSTATLATLRAALPEATLVLLAPSLTRAVAEAARRHHADGVLLRSESAFEVVTAIEQVARGHSVFPPGWQARARDLERRPFAPALTARQREVLDLIMLGLSNEEVAERLGRSPNTIKFHVRAIYARLGVHNRVGALRRMAQDQLDSS